LICVDGYTNILIKVITIVFELMRSQTLLEFAVCNLHTRKMILIFGWKDEDFVVKKLSDNWFVCQKKSLISCEVKIFWLKEFLIIWTQVCVI
jgi:hypothetical protein